jgi:SAM-dependent methyltransferase
MLQLYLFLEKRFPPAFKQLIPEQWRIWLGYMIKVRRNKWSGFADTLRHPLQLPEGATEHSLFDYLASFQLADRGDSTEFRDYLTEAFRRFLYTLALVPLGSGKLLEIGASPYFNSLLLRRFTAYDLTFTNYFGPAFGSGGQETMVSPSERVRFEYHNLNIEEEPLPMPQHTFDVVLLCEVLEHFTNDPFLALSQIKRVLKPGGTLILTTPNVNRLANVARMVAGHNIYDPYSSYGPYGRHNREYTCAELRALLHLLGFTIDEMFTSDVVENRARQFVDPDRLVPLVEQRRQTLGYYIFVRARNTTAATDIRPGWLFRGYTENRAD